jgi:hypothetical protein
MAWFFSTFFADLTLAEVGQALGLKILNSENPVTVILAKSSNRYR